MRIIDPGHLFELDMFDRLRLPHKYLYEPQWLRFVKRAGPGYPGNVGVYPGTNMQEVIRALISRTQYVNNQISDKVNLDAISYLRKTLYCFEERAALRHGREPVDYTNDLELMPTCERCGHIGCDGVCRNEGGGCE